MPPSDPSPHVVAIVVSFNRRDLLLEALDALAAQSAPLHAVVVVDNASSDGSSAAARAAFPATRVVELERNVGGAGGFAAGIAVAQHDLQPDWLWLMDDDTIPSSAALEALLAATRVDPAPVVVGSRVLWTDGRDHPMNSPRRRPIGRTRSAEWARLGLVPVRSSSFVSMLVDARAASRHGLPIADYFIWNDDFEYSTRLIRGGQGAFAPSSVVVHKTRVLGSTDADPGDRFYYEVRNKLWFFFRARTLGPVEWSLYALSSGVRWVRTVARSRDRRRLIRVGLRGLRDGIRRGPRSNAEVLGGLAGLAPDLFRDQGAR